MNACTNHWNASVCWRCSDQDPRWREWRLRAGLPAEPPNKRPITSEERVYEERELAYALLYCVEPLTSLYDEATRPQRRFRESLKRVASMGWQEGG